MYSLEGQQFGRTEIMLVKAGKLYYNSGYGTKKKIL